MRYCLFHVAINPTVEHDHNLASLKTDSLSSPFLRYEIAFDGSKGQLNLSPVKCHGKHRKREVEYRKI